jgi:membrane protein required for colicin V production
MNVSVLDIILTIPLLWAVFQGFRRGFVIEIATLIALILGVWGAIHFSHLLADFLRESLGWESRYLPTVAFGIAFIGILLLVILVGKLVTKAVKLVALGIPNRIAGAVFSVAKYALILSALIFLFEALNAKFKWITDEQKKDSVLYPPIEKILPSVLPMIEEIEYKSWFEEKQQEIREAVEL